MPPVMLPTLETARLIVRPRTLEDLGDCIAMDRDPEVTKYIPGPWRNPERHEHFVRARMAAAYPPGLGYWSLFARDAPDDFLGWVLLIPYDGEGPEIEIGWRLVRRAWGRGYAAEAAHAVAHHGFETAGLARIVADIDPGNAGSIRVAEKIGMAFAGAGTYDGRPCQRFVLTREDWRVSAGTPQTP